MGQEEFEGFHQHKHSVHITFGVTPEFAKVLERIIAPPIQTQLSKILRLTQEIKHQMATDQQTLLDKVAAIQDSENQEAATLDAIKTEVEALKAEHPALDFSTLDALLGASTANTAKAGVIEGEAGQGTGGQ